MKKGLIVLGAAIMCCTMAFGAKYKKVTSTEQIKAGDVVIFVCEDTNKANGGFEKVTNTKNTYLLDVDVTIVGDSITTTAATEFTLGKSGSNWTFTTGGTSTMGKKQTGDDKMAINKGTTTHSITISSTATIIMNMDGDEYTIRYNQNKFRYYKPSSLIANNVKLYLRVQAGEEEVHVESVSLNKQAADVTVGNTLTLVETVLPENADNKNVTWSSDNQAVATVTDGVVTAVAEGKANIIVTTEDGGKKDTCVVTVKGVLPDTKMYRITDIKQQLVDSAWICFGSLDDTTKVMGTYESGNNIKPMEVTINEDGTLNVGAKALYGVVVNISTDTTYAFVDSNDKYIYAASTSSNHLKAQDAVYYWKVEIDEEGDLVKSVTNTSRGVLRYNESSDIFSCYQSFGSQKHIILYSSIKATDTPTEVVNVNDNDNHNVQKVIRNGRVVIVRDGVEYDLMGGRL